MTNSDILRLGRCNELWEWVEVPLGLPKIGDRYVRDMVSLDDEITDAFRRNARKMGATEVIVPIINERNCEVTYEAVGINHVVLWVWEHLNTPTIIVVINDAAIPIARINNGEDDAKHTERLIDIAKAVLLIRRNPWFIEALRKSILDALSNITRTNEMATKAYSALKLIGAEVID